MQAAAQACLASHRLRKGARSIRRSSAGRSIRRSSAGQLRGTRRRDRRGGAPRIGILRPL
jgi:hypothetical protein